METKYIIGLLAGLFIYIGIVSGLYLVYKPNIEHQREQFRKVKEARRKAKEMADEVKKFQHEHDKEPEPKEEDQNQDKET